MAAQRHRACRRAWVQGVEDLVGVHHMGYLDNLRIVSRPLLSRSSCLLHCIAFSLSRISHHLALHPPHPPQASISRAYPTRYTRIRIHAQCLDLCSHSRLADTPSLRAAPTRRPRSFLSHITYARLAFSRITFSALPLPTPIPHTDPYPLVSTATNDAPAYVVSPSCR